MGDLARRGRIHSPSSVVACVRAALFLVACGLGLTACGVGASTGSATASRAGRPDVGRRTGEVRVQVVRGLGDVLVDGEGYTLYAYVPDQRRSSKCHGACATEWPPLLLPRGARHPAAGSGSKGALLGSDRRSSGVRQVTYGGWPLYLYRRDGAPGDAFGQGDTMGLWYAVNPDGALNRQPIKDT